jgi:hypothetical protein
MQCLSQNAVIGVLEETPGHYAGDPSYRSVRVVFWKGESEWQAFPSECSDQACLKKLAADYPERTTWTIVFGGKKVGQVTTLRPTEYRWYRDVGQQQIIGEVPAPVVGTRSREFAGYFGAAAYRPLIANSQPLYEDPEDWKLAPVSPSLGKTLRKAFRARFPKLCRLTDNEESELETFPYRDDEIKLAKSYRSSRGWTIAGLHLEATDCAGTEAGFQIDDPWFAVAPNGSINYLDSGIWLVDAGDYDNDGNAELVFSINRENEGGYEIFYDSFKRHAAFRFTYH